MKDKLTDNESLNRWKKNYRQSSSTEMPLYAIGRECGQWDEANGVDLSKLNIELHEAHPDFLDKNFSIAIWNRFIIDECRESILSELRDTQKKIFNIVKELHVIQYRLKMLHKYPTEVLDTTMVESLEDNIIDLQRKLLKAKKECKLLNRELEDFNQIQNDILHSSEKGYQYYSKEYINDGWE